MASEDRTVMEKPEQRDRAFTIVVPHGLYIGLRKMMVSADVGLGGICRELLTLITPVMYMRLLKISKKKKYNLIQMVRRELQNFIDKND